MSAYGSDVSVEAAVSNLFDDPTWGTGDGSVDSNNLKRNALSGKDHNGDDWVVHFYCNADDPTEWFAEVKVFTTAEGYYASFLDEHGSDLLMRCILRRSAATGAVISGRLAAQRPPVIRWSF